MYGAVGTEWTPVPCYIICPSMVDDMLALELDLLIPLSSKEIMFYRGTFHRRRWFLLKGALQSLIY